MARSSNTSGASGRFILSAAGEDLLVYDTASQRVTSLNPFAAAVWRAAGEDAAVEAVVARLATEGLGGAEREAVEKALAMLDAAGLLEAPAVAAEAVDQGRRALFGRLAIGGAVAAAVLTPVVATIVAPTPAQAAS